MRVNVCHIMKIYSQNFTQEINIINHINSCITSRRIIRGNVEFGIRYQGLFLNDCCVQGYINNIIYQIMTIEQLDNLSAIVLYPITHYTKV